MTAQPMLPPAGADRPIVLGLYPGGREVGLAIATRDHLVRAYVLNLRKIPSPEGRERRFQQVLAKCLDAYGIARLAIVNRRRPSRTRAICRQMATMNTLARSRTIPVAYYAACAAKRAVLGPEVARASNAAVAEALATRFPELKPKAPSSEAVPGADRIPELARIGRRFVTPRARYWSRMFLALTAAVHDLDVQATPPLIQTP